MYKCRAREGVLFNANSTIFQLYINVVQINIYIQLYSIDLYRYIQLYSIDLYRYISCFKLGRWFTRIYISYLYRSIMYRYIYPSKSTF
jgi:hypothetical protein